MREQQRGSALVVAVVVMLVVAVIGVGMVRFTQRQVAGATAGMRLDSVAACAEAGRKLLLSRFHLFGAHPTEVSVLDARVDGPGGRMRAMGGHVDGDPARTPVQVRQVEYQPNLIKNPYRGDGLSNRIVDTDGAGGSPYRVIVHCQEGDLGGLGTGRQLEIEFGVNFGL